MPTVSNHSDVFKLAHSRMKQRNSSPTLVAAFGKMTMSEALKYAWSTYRVQKATKRVIAEVKSKMQDNPEEVVSFYKSNEPTLRAARLTD